MLFFAVNIPTPLPLHRLHTLFTLRFPWFSKFCFLVSSFLLYMSYNRSTEKCLGSFTSGPLSSFAEETTSGDFVWVTEYEEKMNVVMNSISQSPSVENDQIKFDFIDDMKVMFDLNSSHMQTKRSTFKQKLKNAKNVLHEVDTVNAPIKKLRPRNAFILYRAVLQASKEFEGMTQTKLSRLIASRWNNEEPEIRAHFNRFAELEKGTLIFWLQFIDNAAFGYGATDIFNIDMGSQESDLDPEQGPPSNMISQVNEQNGFNSNQHWPLGNCLKNQQTDSTSTSSMSLAAGYGSPSLCHNSMAQFYCDEDSLSETVPLVNGVNAFDSIPVSSVSHYQHVSSNLTSQHGNRASYFTLYDQTSDCHDSLLQTSCDPNEFDPPNYPNGQPSDPSRTSPTSLAADGATYYPISIQFRNFRFSTTEENNESGSLYSNVVAPFDQDQYSRSKTILAIEEPNTFDSIQSSSCAAYQRLPSNLMSQHSDRALYFTLYDTSDCQDSLSQTTCDPNEFKFCNYPKDQPSDPMSLAGGISTQQDLKTEENDLSYFHPGLEAPTSNFQYPKTMETDLSCFHLNPESLHGCSIFP